MSTNLEPERVTFPAEVVQILPGDPARVIVKTRMINPKGAARTFVQHLQVRDAALFEGLATQVSVGEEIEVTAVTVFPEGERYYTYLADFAKAAPCPERNEHAAAGLAVVSTK